MRENRFRSGLATQKFNVFHWCLRAGSWELTAGTQRTAHGSSPPPILLLCRTKEGHPEGLHTVQVSCLLALHASAALSTLLFYLLTSSCALAAELHAGARAARHASSTRTTGKSVWNLSPVAGAFVCNEKHSPPSSSNAPPLLFSLLLLLLRSLMPYVLLFHK